MVIADRLDEGGKVAWAAAVIGGFLLWWPLGLATLLFVVASGRLAAWRAEAPGTWSAPWQGGMRGASRWGGCGGGGGRRSRGGSGNRAFDEYRADTLRRLEEEQREFAEYLERLRQARDKQEFDAFMAERRGRETPAPDAA